MIPPFMFATGIENSCPTIQGGTRPRRRDGEVRPLPPLAHRLRLRRGPRPACPALRPAAAPHLARPGSLRLGVRRRDVRRPARARHHADRRPLPLRRAGLDRQLPEPGLSRRCSRAMRGPSPSASRWVQLYTPVNEMFICATFSAAYGWWNEQLHERPGVRHRAEAHRQGQRAGDAGDPRGAAGRDLHPERIVRVLPCRQPRRRSSRPRSATRRASCRSTSTTAGASTPRCTST